MENREKAAQYYKDVFKLEEKELGPNGTIYLSDGFVDVALIKTRIFRGAFITLGLS